MDKVHVICPSISELEEDCKRDITCPIPGCGKILPQKQSLKFHVVKVHGIIKVCSLLVKSGSAEVGDAADCR